MYLATLWAKLGLLPLWHDMKMYIYLYLYTIVTLHMCMY